jgi:hypothetical protein
MTHDPTIDTTPLDYDAEPENEWLEEPEQTPRRPRRRLLAPVPVTLLVVLLLAGAFFAGVEVEKGQTSSGTSAGLPAGLSALRSRLGTGGAASSGSSSSTRGSSGGGFAGAGGFSGAGGGSFPGGGATTGEVSFASGNTLYVTSSEGNTVKVSAPAGTKVSKTVSTNLNSIHPGDTVVVRGTQNKNGSVSASSISISSSGGSSNSGASNASTGGGGSTQQLFGGG